MTETIRIRIMVRGLVQGVGFRPFVYTLANRYGLSGWVGNQRSGVIIEIQGVFDSVARFTQELEAHPPPNATIESVEGEPIPLLCETGFAIVESDATSSDHTRIPADLAICVECQNELTSSSDRRFGHPFITCTHCGPRFSIIDTTPFDRTNTSMSSFAMCNNCEAEYANPSDRRFHSQTSCCRECGPQVTFICTTNPSSSIHGDKAISAARQSLKSGMIVAIKGIGGFHLACDATNDAAVRRLRERKERGAKPFAIMAPNLACIRRYAHITPTDEALLTGRERPIVLLDRRAALDGLGLSPSVAPTVHTLGFMLPYSPLHHLLTDGMTLVMTSGNVSGDPVVIDNDDALSQLGEITDVILVHDRDIVLSCDDSVIRTVREKPYFIRRSRGYAPLPIRLPCGGPTVLAVGGEWKASIGLAVGDQCYLGPHIGDIGSPKSLNAMEQCATHFMELLHATPAFMACDRHPGYLSSQWAERFAKRNAIPLIRVQHHRAHVTSLMADIAHDDNVIGVCFDGTGYGDDGAIWGGEFFLADGFQMRRIAHLAYTLLPGGDAAIRYPYRTALAQLWAAKIPWSETIPAVRACPVAERTILWQQLERRLHSPLCSSIGRLFDAVSAILGICLESTYEGQAAIELESACEGEPSEGYIFPQISGEILQLDPVPVIRQIVEDYGRGSSVGDIASRFHLGLAQSVVQTCRAIRDRSGVHIVGLTGGVFQNVRLLQWTMRELESAGFEVIIHRQVPANDGGLSLGQAVFARYQIASGS